METIACIDMKHHKHYETKLSKHPHSKLKRGGSKQTIKSKRINPAESQN